FFRKIGSDSRDYARKGWDWERWIMGFYTFIPFDEEGYKYASEDYGWITFINLLYGFIFLKL
ncbi:MAG: hypothetical protein JSW28_03575, partial [Thermoplasmata archaeon]